MTSDSPSDRFPQASTLEDCLTRLAAGIGDKAPNPIGVNMLRVHGGKPPIYLVVIRSPSKEPLRQRLERLLNRQLAFGVSSFMLRADEAAQIIAAQPNADHVSDAP